MSRTYAAIPPPPFLYGEPAAAAKEEPLEYDPFIRIKFWEGVNQQKQSGRLATKLRARMQPAVAGDTGTEGTHQQTYLGGGLGYSGSVEGGSGEARKVCFVGATSAPASRFSTL